uniref:Uncharacterized protein n=1 Tax=Setaria italica TaxID=4555 RepID=K3ZYU5_SETIT
MNTRVRTRHHQDSCRQYFNKNYVYQLYATFDFDPIKASTVISYSSASDLATMITGSARGSTVGMF